MQGLDGISKKKSGDLIKRLIPRINSEINIQIYFGDLLLKFRSIDSTEL